MAILGFIFCCLIMIWLSVVCFFALWNNTGKYNIGGVPNSLTTKVGSYVFLVIVVLLWWVLFKYSPFIVTVKG